MTYKKICIALLTSITLTSCVNDKLQMADAKRCATAYLDAIKQKDFDRAISLYSNESNENKLDEIKKLDLVFGDIKTVALVDSAEVTGEEENIKLTYQINHSKLQSKETFIIIKEEGNYKIFSHQVRSGIE